MEAENGYERQEASLNTKYRDCSAEKKFRMSILMFAPVVLTCLLCGFNNLNRSAIAIFPLKTTNPDSVGGVMTVPNSGGRCGDVFLISVNVNSDSVQFLCLSFKHCEPKQSKQLKTFK